jgi:hypothetical protein
LLDEKEEDHSLSGDFEIRDFAIKLIGDDLAHNPGISDRCEQGILKRKRRRRRIEANSEWFTARSRVGG